MATIANTAFEVRISNHEFDSLANITGTYQNASNAAEACPAGFLCVRKEQSNNEGYVNLGPSASALTIKNSNSWIMNAAGATDNAQTPIYASNTFNVNQVGGYKVGSQTLGLEIPAGENGTFTQIRFDNVCVYRFGAGNVNGTVGSNKYFTIAAGLLVPAAAAPTDGMMPYFELVGSGNFTEGAYQSFGYYDLRACTSVAAASKG